MEYFVFFIACAVVVSGSGLMAMMIAGLFPEFKIEYREYGLAWAIIRTLWLGFIFCSVLAAWIVTSIPLITKLNPWL